ncbi:hypothetical protein PV327_005901 [Microctonus hyperodae]|uniref:Androglobin n=1 Tax=Microctonus hyperodae TaxID=165561 RepID=A0AA39L0B4_MICHY|nr:hypothetical protein PV327_005901 [Microctonus hyperodae]
MSNNSKKVTEANVSVSFSRYDSIAWPKWSDNDLNSEQWNNSRGSSTQFYDDPQSVSLPSSLKPHSWKRPHEIQNFKPIIYSPQSSKNYPNLFVNNQHLLISEFMRWFISSVTILFYYGRDGLEITESSSLSWNYRDKPWHGSLHIYSMNKAGPGEKHNPQINPHGRYVARLFFMGYWRRIEIDDLIPFDNEGRSLLPHTENYQELWSVLLAKAMLKIAALSWDSHHEINDFNPIVCLTGWTCLSLNITHLSPNDRWELLSKYSKDNKLSNKSENESDDLKEDNKIIDKQKNTNRKHKNSFQVVEKVNQINNNSIVTLLSISNANNNLNEVPDGIIPNYPAYVESTCDVKSNPALIKPPLESWKLHRWIPWAMRQGIIDPADYFIPTRRIFLLNPTNAALINENEKVSSMWLDFNKLSDYPMCVYFFFKLEYFKYVIDVADVSLDELHGDKKEKLNSVSRMNKKKLKEQESDDTIQTKKYYNYNHIGTQSRNEPLYLFIDSIHSKFLLFNFSALSQVGKNSSLIIERHCWFKRSLENKPLLEIKTLSIKAKALCLEAGRHLLRIYCQSENSYHLTISSNTNFQVGNRKEMHELMQSESERIKLLANKIINSMNDAFNSFGSVNYRNNLKNYYRSYMPEKKNNISDIKSYKTIHDHFAKELTKLAIDNCSGNILEALKIFFLNPEINKNSESLSDDNPINSAPKPSMENIGEGEKDNYHREQTLVNAATLSDLYPCSDDFQKVLDVQKIEGNLSSILPHQWVPIVRLTVNVPNDSIVFACLDLFVDLPVYILQVFNNDTGRELQRVVNNVIPFHYQRKIKGYSVIGYGWTQSKRVKDLKWSLHVTTIKGDPKLNFFNEDQPISLSLEIPPLQLYELSNVYIPNVNNLIFNAILKTPGDCWISLRVSTTYKGVRMKLKIKKTNKKIVREINGASIIIVPIIYLEKKDCEWIIEAIVSPNSWPLTAKEWDIVSKTKTIMNAQTKVRNESTSSIGKISKNRQESKFLSEGPRWCLQVAIDAGAHAELYQDSSRHVEIQKIKESWGLHDPNRINRGRKIRENFLHDNYVQNVLQEDSEFIHDKIRTLKPPQMQEISSLNLSTFFIDNENENRRLKTESDEELDTTIRQQNIIAFEETQTLFIKRSNNLLRELQLNVALSARMPIKRNE